MSVTDLIKICHLSVLFFTFVAPMPPSVSGSRKKICQFLRGKFQIEFDPIGYFGLILSSKLRTQPFFMEWDWPGIPGIFWSVFISGHEKVL